MRIIKKGICFALLVLMLLPMLTVPAAQAFSDSRANVMGAGSAHSVAIDENGTLWAWGDNSQGQLGDGSWINRRVPVRIMDGVTAVSAGDRYNLAIRNDGSLWAWGQNDRGQLGDGTTVNRRSPVRILEDVIYVAAGWKRTEGGLGGGTPSSLWQHSLAITSDGSLWAWGDNIVGQLGDGTTVSRHRPVRVMDGVVAVSAGDMFTMVIRDDGSLWAWGQNSRGQFGNGTTVSSRIPVRLMDSVAAVYAGDAYSMVLKNDGSLWAMGQNDRGQFGNGNRTSSNVPVKLLDGVVTISASGNHTMAVKTDGSLWVWGQNDRGQFGVGTTISSSTPVRVTDGIAAVATGDKHTLAIQADGSLWAWGLNNRSQVGDGTRVNRFSPVKIMGNVAMPDVPRVMPPSVILNGELLPLDVPPQIIGGKAMVPLRAIFEAMGAEIQWDPRTNTVTAERDGVTISLMIGSDVLVRNGASITLEVPAQTISGITFVPVSAISGSFGAEAVWHADTRTIVITVL